MSADEDPGSAMPPEDGSFRAPLAGAGVDGLRCTWRWVIKIGGVVALIVGVFVVLVVVHPPTARSLVAGVCISPVVLMLAVAVAYPVGGAAAAIFGRTFSLGKPANFWLFILAVILWVVWDAVAKHYVSPEFRALGFPANLGVILAVALAVGFGRPMEISGSDHQSPESQADASDSASAGGM